MLPKKVHEIINAVLSDEKFRDKDCDALTTEAVKRAGG